jgi:Zn-dependent protease
MFIYTEKKPKFRITRRELFHILISWLAITFAFSWGAIKSGSLSNALYMFGVYALILATGFILHELAHKFAAIKYNAEAEYFMWKPGIIFALVLSFITGGAFVFAAPGAVYIYGKYLSRKENGIISIAGPLTNLAVGVIFLILGFALLTVAPGISVIAFLVTKVNAFLGLFNMVPIYPLDGSKVLAWSLPLWLATTAVLLAIFMFV